MSTERPGERGLRRLLAAAILCAAPAPVSAGDAWGLPPAPGSPVAIDRFGGSPVFRPVGAGRCQTHPSAALDMYVLHAEDLTVCQRLCHVDAFPCAAVDYSAVSHICRIHYTASRTTAPPLDDDGGTAVCAVLQR